MRNLDGSKFGDRNCDYSCEYCSYDNQYLQRIKKVSIKKDRKLTPNATVFFD